MAETVFADNYEEITGKSRESFTVETKVITAPAETPVAPAAVAETK
jgi:hypothetical protein